MDCNNIGAIIIVYVYFPYIINNLTLLFDDYKQIFSEIFYEIRIIQVNRVIASIFCFN